MTDANESALRHYEHEQAALEREEETRAQRVNAEVMRLSLSQAGMDELLREKAGDDLLAGYMANLMRQLTSDNDYNIIIAAKVLGECVNRLAFHLAEQTTD